MKFGLILSFLLVSMLLVTPVFALTIKDCLNSSILQVNMTTTIWVNSNETNISTTEEVYCPYGCDNDECKLGTVLNTITLPLFFIFFAFFIILTKFSDNNPLFGTIASTISLILGVLLIGQGITISETILANIYIQGFGTIFLVLGIYVLLAVWVRHIPGREE